jgi:hypothetical protein
VASPRRTPSNPTNQVGKASLLGLVWFRKNEEMTALAAGFGISRATGYRYRDEVIAVLAAEAPDLHEALQQVAEQGCGCELRADLFENRYGFVGVRARGLVEGVFAEGDHQ